MKVKGVLLATAAGSLAAPGAFAADLAVKAPAAMVYAPTWTGLYIGVHGGAAWVNSESSQSTAYGPDTVTAKNTGFIGGGQIGYNWQSGNLVLGAEADISGVGGTASESYNSFYGGSTTFDSKVNWLATFRARVGLAVGDTLVYGTAGLAVADVENSLVYCCSTTWSNKETRTGLTAGVGIEHMFDRHWTARLEGLWVDLGKSGVVQGALSSGSVVSDKPTKFKNQMVIVRGALNYKF